MTMQERTDDMLDRYGECCTRVKAAKILGRSTAWVNTAMKDGRLDTACGGTMVDVRSIARYLCSPKTEDNNARMQKMRTKRNIRWSV